MHPDMREIPGVASALETLACLFLWRTFKTAHLPHENPAKILSTVLAQHRSTKQQYKKISYNLWSEILVHAHFFWCHSQLEISTNVLLNNCCIIPGALRAELWPFLPRCLKRRHYLFVLSFHSPNQFTSFCWSMGHAAKSWEECRMLTLLGGVFLPVVCVQTHWSCGCFSKEDVSQE